METQTYVRDIASLRIADAEDAGGKGANLGELVAAELPVPGGLRPDEIGLPRFDASGRCRHRTGDTALFDPVALIEEGQP